MIRRVTSSLFRILPPRTITKVWFSSSGSVDIKAEAKFASFLKEVESLRKEVPEYK